jgi:sugar-specific transcriptional regulator TrmB
MDYYDNEIDREVDDIISQIKNQSKSFKDAEEKFISKKITKDEMENFIIENAAHIVQQSVDMVNNLSREAIASADPKIVDSVAGLVRATTTAIDSLTKLKIAEDKNNTQKEIAQMSAKKDEENPKGLMLSRDDVMKFLSTGQTP